MIGFDWRLDYNVRSGDAGKENNPSYLITLQVRGVDGDVSNMNFSCTPEQLQDLAAAIRDATQQVRHFSSKVSALSRMLLVFDTTSAVCAWRISRKADVVYPKSG